MVKSSFNFFRLTASLIDVEDALYKVYTILITPQYFIGGTEHPSKSRNFGRGG
jgi:hypothetical protein